jgi:ATP-dependent DNA helicase PIF1
LLLDDAEYVAAMQDMCETVCSVDALRRQFALLLVHCRPTNAQAIFAMFRSELCGCDDPQDWDVQCTVWALADYCSDMGRSLDELGFVLPETPMMITYPEDDVGRMRQLKDIAFAQFSDEQSAAADRILAAVENGQGGIFYIQASGGCGKSFWANGVCAALRVAGYKPIVVAASGLAATVLEGGRTAHSVFGIPLDVDEHSWCSCDSSSRAAITLSEIVFWDECSMLHVDAANCVNRSMQDWTKRPESFGGKVMVFMGDFQQLLPVVRGGSGDAATIMEADWWSHVTILKFTRNYRSDDAAYCSMLHQVGTGALSEVSIPEERIASDLDALCAKVFCDCSGTHDAYSHIVTLTLEDAAKINSHIIAQLPGTLVTAAAADVKINCKEPDLYSDEFVHSLSIPGAPPALLDLKEGARSHSMLPRFL